MIVELVLAVVSQDQGCKKTTLERKKTYVIVFGENKKREELGEKKNVKEMVSYST